MTVALIVPANTYFCPYLKIYTNILDHYQIKYDVIYWDKECLNEDGVSFKFALDAKDNFVKKIIGYYLFSKFAKKAIAKHAYKKLIVFTPQLGLFLYSFLKKNYYKQFIFDYRDLSIEQKMKKRFVKFLNICNLICISSPGFKKHLPQEYDYILSHNIDVQSLRKALYSDTIITLNKSDKITVSTIGGIRDYDANRELIDSLKNNNDFLICFIGKGPAAESLYKYAKLKKINNIFFRDFYIKTEEPKFIEDSSFLNIYYPKLLSHSTALSNRFYNALIYRRPMIVTSESIQGDYVNKYNLGIVVDDCSKIPEQLKLYFDTLDVDSFVKNSNELLVEIEADYLVFEKKILNYLYC